MQKVSWALYCFLMQMPQNKLTKISSWWLTHCGFHRKATFKLTFIFLTWKNHPNNSILHNWCCIKNHCIKLYLGIAYFTVIWNTHWFSSEYIINTQITIIIVVIAWTLVISGLETLSRDFPFWLRSVIGQWCSNMFLLHKNVGKSPSISLMWKNKILGRKGQKIVRMSRYNWQFCRREKALRKKKGKVAIMGKLSWQTSPIWF